MKLQPLDYLILPWSKPQPPAQILSGMVIGLDFLTGGESPARVAAKALRKAVKSTGQRRATVQILRSPVSDTLPEKLSMLSMSLVDDAPFFVEAATSLREALASGEPLMH